MRPQPGVLFVESQADEVNSLVAPGGRELHSRDEADARSLAAGAGFAQARGGVMVGERQDADPAFPGAGDQLRRRQHAIGVMAVGVKIDQSFSAGVHRGSV
jgi:hypothetical protein